MAGQLSTEALDAAPAPSLHATGTVEHGAVGRAALVRLLVVLKWTLWKRSFRKNVGKIIGTVFGMLYAIGFLAMLTAGLGGAALLVDGAQADAFALALRILGIGVVLAWLVGPLLVFGMDDTLDPRRFAALPRTAAELQPGLLAAAALSLPTLVTVIGLVIASICEVIWMATTGAAGTTWLLVALVLLVPANLLGLLTCLMLPRAILARSAVRQGSRAGRERRGVIGMIAVFVLIYGASLAMQTAGSLGQDHLVQAARMAADVLSWTPLGAAFSVPIDAAQGHGLTALVRLIVAVATVLALQRWWLSSIRLALQSALAGEASSGSTAVTALVPRLGRSNPLGAVWGRSLRAWRRDSRYRGAMAIMPVLLVFFTIMGMISPSQRPSTLFVVVVVTAVSAMTICNDIGLDGPAGWVNITAGLPSRPNLLGRVLAAATYAVPFALIACTVVPLLLGYADMIPLMIMGSLGTMLSAWGISLLIAVTLAYPVGPPGTNPMRDRSSSSSGALLATFAAMIGLWVPQLPALVMVGAALVLSPSLLPIAGIVSLVCGALSFWLCLIWASKILESTYVALFQKVRAFV